MESRQKPRIMQLWLLSLTLVLSGISSAAKAQDGVPLGDLPTRATGGLTLLTTANQDLTMVVNSSHTIQTNEPIKYVTVDNPEIITAQPIESTKIQLAARRNGVTQVEFVTGEGKSYTLQIVVFGDSRELEIILRRQFPNSQLKVIPIQTGCIVSGVVADSDDVETAISIAELYFTRVINGIQVMGVHQVLLHTQVMEVSRSKLRDLGFDWQLGNSGDFAVQSSSGLAVPGLDGTTLGATGQDTFRFGVVGNNSAFFGLIRALRQNNLVKVLADPTVVAVDGRPASFNSGGEFPIVVPSGLGQVGIEFREFGTRVDFVAKVRGDTRIALEVRPTISEIDPTRSVTIAGTTVPGLRSRFVDTAVELNAGQTLAIAGLIQVRSESEIIGIPWLSELPYLGVPFRRTREVQNEVELLILVTPELVEAMDPCEVPMTAPGLNTQAPTDCELFFRGYLETPVDGAIDAGAAGCIDSSGQTQLFNSPVAPPMQAPPGNISTEGLPTVTNLQNNGSNPAFPTNGPGQVSPAGMQPSQQPLNPQIQSLPSNNTQDNSRTALPTFPQSGGRQIR
jgi:pilus assembly protein CpaC